MTNTEIIIQVSIAVVTTISTLAAAYFGAKFAFDFQNKKNSEDLIHAIVKAANMAIFALMRSHHELTAIKKQYLDPSINDQDRHFSIPPSASLVPHLDIEFNDLSFLLSSSNPNLLNELALTQSEINATVDIINARSKFHLTEFQPLLDGHNQRIKQGTTLAEFEEIIGQRVTHTLKTVTDAMIDNVDEALTILVKKADEMYKITKALYPKHGVVRMTFRQPDSKA